MLLNRIEILQLGISKVLYIFDHGQERNLLLQMFDGLIVGRRLTVWNSVLPYPFDNNILQLNKIIFTYSS